MMKTLYKWHRWVGLTVGLFVIKLAITGIFLTTTQNFGLPIGSCTDRC